MPDMIMKIYRISIPGYNGVISGENISRSCAQWSDVADTGKDLKDKFNDFIDNLSSKAEDLAEEADEFANKANPQYQ